MRSEWGKLRWVSQAVVVLVLLGGTGTLSLQPVCAQAPGGAIQQVPPPPFGNPNGRRNEEEDDPLMRRQREKQAVARNTQRQEQLVKDSDKLLALATELKTEVDKTNKDMLSIDVIKKAEEIEKLAKSVREKMRE